MSNEQQKIEDKLIDEVNERYINLSKWMIGISTGAIVFSVRLVKPETPHYLNQVLLYGLGFLVLNIFSGVTFVRLRIDALYYQLLELRVKTEIENLRNDDLERELKWGGKKKKIKDILKYDEDLIKKTQKKFKRINNAVVIILPIHQWTFFFGITLVAIFGGSVLLFVK
ncbi:MAG: hypothetical protein WC324_02395 [Candidatus Omnitrophota bacterium]|jgi:hypothetical protein